MPPEKHLTIVSGYSVGDEDRTQLTIVPPHWPFVNDDGYQAEKRKETG
jgi:hypothetical protein